MKVSEITDIIPTQADVHNVIYIFFFFFFLDKSKTTGPDMIHNKLIISTVDFFYRILTHRI